VEGRIVGTVAYMSPEQAEGKPIDPRSDIFSFGAMLYEMITGKRAFEGDTLVSTLAAILRGDAPEISTDIGLVPGDMKRIIRRCLEKSPDRRWQSIADVRVLLDDLKQDSQAVQPIAALPTVQRGGVPRWVLGLAVIAILALAALAFWRRPQAETPPDIYTFHRVTSDASSNTSPAISPDGKLIAYSSDRSQSGATDIWVRQSAGGEAVRLTSNLGMCWGPSFSPDGSKIVFQGGPDARGIYVVSTFGGEARRVADGRVGKWAPDGALIAYLGTTNDRILLVPAIGGTPRELLLKHSTTDSPRWLPDGKRLMFRGIDPTTQSADWYTIPVEGGEEKSCGATKWLRDPFAGAYLSSVTPDGVFVTIGQVDTQNIYRVPFDAVNARVTGPPQPVTMAASINFWPTASADGTKVVFGSASSYDTNLWEVPIDPVRGEVAGEPRQLTKGLMDQNAPNPFPDGSRLVHKATAGRTQEIRVLDIASGRDTRIAETSDVTQPVVSEDGTQLAYAVREQDAWSTYTVPAAGGIARRLCNGCGRPVQWIGNDARILYDKAAKNKEIGVLDVASGKTTTILRSTVRSIYTPRLSPDRRLLIFTSLTGGRDAKLYVVPFSDDRLVPEQEYRQVIQSPASDERQALWSPDGRLLYFLSDRDGFRCVWAA
jgi:Tol biopolymer transport system component